MTGLRTFSIALAALGLASCGQRTECIDMPAQPGFSVRLANDNPNDRKATLLVNNTEIGITFVDSNGPSIRGGLVYGESTVGSNAYPTLVDAITATTETDVDTAANISGTMDAYLDAINVGFEHSFESGSSNVAPLTEVYNGYLAELDIQPQAARRDCLVNNPLADIASTDGSDGFYVAEPENNSSSNNTKWFAGLLLGAATLAGAMWLGQKQSFSFIKAVTAKRDNKDESVVILRNNSKDKHDPQAFWILVQRDHADPKKAARADVFLYSTDEAGVTVVEAEGQDYFMHPSLLRRTKHNTAKSGAIIGAEVVRQGAVRKALKELEIAPNAPAFAQRVIKAAVKQLG